MPDLVAEAERGGAVLVVAHGNSLRALRKELDQISDDEITELEIPTGIPYRYVLDGSVVMAIDIEGLAKAYDEHLVLKGIDLEVPDGCCIALLGPNGAGKTTTVEILEGYRPRDGGRVSGARRRPGLAVPGLALAPRHRPPVLERTPRTSACTEVAPRTSPPSTRARGRSTRSSTLVGPERAGATTGCGSLSGGQRRRLDVGLGIIGRPELLFLDEPTTGFDPEARRQFWSMIRGPAGPRARPSCSPRTTSTRPRSSPTTWPIIAAAGIMAARARRRRSGAGTTPLATRALAGDDDGAAASSDARGRLGSWPSSGRSSTASCPSSR